MKTVGFIGCGNMGGALAEAIIKKIGAENVYVSDFDTGKSARFCEKTGAKAVDNEYICLNCDYIYLAVKPQHFESVLSPLKDIFKTRKNRFILVTMAAGLSKKGVLNMAGGDYPIIRIMPNTPCAIGTGVVLYSAGETVTEEEISFFINMLSYAGLVDSISEDIIDAAAALSGCGPAFSYMFIDALARGAEECGVPYDKALLYAARTVSGACGMVIDSHLTPEELTKNVCSPGGTTIEGVNSLLENNFPEISKNSVISAFNKTKLLKK